MKIERTVRFTIEQKEQPAMFVATHLLEKMVETIMYSDEVVVVNGSKYGYYDILTAHNLLWDLVQQDETPLTTECENE